MSTSIALVFKLAQLVNERCLELTAGIGYLKVNEVFKEFFTEYSTEVEINGYHRCCCCRCLPLLNLDQCFGRLRES